MHYPGLRLADCIRRNTDLENYSLLLALQRTMTQALGYTIEDCLIFEDALGRNTRLPYVFFKDWEV